MKNLNALYYPEIVCLSEAVLKYLLLMYDKIYFLPNDIRLSSGSTSISSRFSINDSLIASAFGTQEDAYYSLMYASENNIWDDRLKRLMDMYDHLEEKKICCPINDKKFDFPSKHPLTSAVDSDIQDNNFISACEKYKNEKYFIPPLPDGAKSKGGGMIMMPPRYKKEYMFYSLCSERINSALYFSGKNNLVPVSNSDIYINLLRVKLKRTLQHPNFKKEKQPTNEIKKNKLSILSWEVFKEVIPQHILITKDIKQILKYKNESIEPQQKLRNHLSNLELMISSEPWDDSFEKEINKLVKLDVIPEATRLQEKKKIIWEKLFNEVVKTTFSKKILIPFLSMHLIPNLSYLDLICYSTAAWMGGVFPKLVDLRQEEKEANRNALFFLLNFK